MLSIFVGNLVQIPLCGKLNVLKNAVVGVKDGKIVVVEENEPGSSTLDQRCREALSREGIEPEKAELIRLQVGNELESVHPALSPTDGCLNHCAVLQIFLLF